MGTYNMGVIIRRSHTFWLVNKVILRITMQILQWLNQFIYWLEEECLAREIIDLVLLEQFDAFGSNQLSLPLCHPLLFPLTRNSELLSQNQQPLQQPIFPYRPQPSLNPLVDLVQDTNLKYGGVKVNFDLDPAAVQIRFLARCLQNLILLTYKTFLRSWSTEEASDLIFLSICTKINDKSASLDKPKSITSPITFRKSQLRSTEALSHGWMKGEALNWNTTNTHLIFFLFDAGLASQA